MKIHRFFVNDSSHFEPIIRDKKLVHQMVRVLRLHPGEQVVIADGQGAERLCRLIAFDDKTVSVECLEERQNTVDSVRDSTLYMAILKREHLEMVVEKATEVGIARIVPIVTERTVKLQVREDRLQTIAREAAEQSGRGRIPMIEPIQSFASALKDASARGEVWFFHLDASAVPSFVPDPIAGFVGPEGGWTDAEIEQARMAGARLCGLGKTILRGETAAVIASYLMTRAS